MPIVDDIAAVRARDDLTEDQKRKAIYDLKGLALVDVIYNGKPAPNPIPPLIKRQFTANGLGIFIHKAEVLENGTLRIIVTLTKAPALPVTHTINIVNPPVLPRSITGNEKGDLIQAAQEMLEGFV